MSKELVIAASPHETKVALLEDGQVVEVSIEREKESGLVGSIYKGRVTRVLPGMQSAFVNIGLERDAFLYVSDFFEDREEYERILASPEEGGSRAPERTPSVPQPAPEPEPQQLTSTEAAALVAEAPAAEATTSPRRGTVPATEPPQRSRLGRRSHRGQRRGRRGGRGRSRPRFESRPHMPEMPSQPESYSPVILPGESLAKYRDRVAQTPHEPVAAPESEARPAPELAPTERPPAEGSAEPGPGDLGSLPTREEPRASKSSREHAIAATPLTTEAFPTLPSPPPAKFEAHREAARRQQKTHYIPVAEVGSEAGYSEPAPEPATAALPEAAEVDTDVPEEIGRRAASVEEANSPVALPPSLCERTAGGVEWERPSLGRRRGRPPRGRRRRRPAAAPGPRAKISELVKSGQETIVQIAKEQIGTKGARITSHVTLPGRYVVYMPTIEHIGVSRRIRPDQGRARLRRLLLEVKASLSGGIVVRTVAESASDEEIRRDLDYLVNLWRSIVQQAEKNPAPALLHRDLTLMERILRDQLTADFQTIWVDSEEAYARVVEFVNRFQPELAPRVKLYTKDVPIFEGLDVQQQIEQALKPKVWLKSGGYIVINHTEALVAIDVNTGKFVGKGSTRLEDTIVRTNLDAVKEIVRQIRLRDLGGIIIIDFIDMEDPRNRHKVMQELERALRSDRSPSKTLAFNEFGLIALTRKRVRQSLEKVLCQPCPYCTGTGMLKSVPTLCYEIQEEAKKMAQTIDAPELTIRAHPEVAKALKSRESGLLAELEEQTKKNIIVQPDQALHFDQYTIF